MRRKTEGIESEDVSGEVEGVVKEKLFLKK